MDNFTTTRVNLFFFILLLFQTVSAVSADQRLVHALLFFSPSCPHCHKVITEDLPPVIEKFGDQVVILGINTYTEKGHELFSATLEHFNIPQEKAGVPMLIVGETVLIGSLEIPQRLPEIITTGLMSGGIDWPAVPGLEQLLKEEISAESNEEARTEKKDVVEGNSDSGNQENKSTTDKNQDEMKGEVDSEYEQRSAIIGDSVAITENMTISERFVQDVTGNSISTFVLIGMIFSVVLAGVLINRSRPVLHQWPNWFAAILWVIGMAVAIYMAYVEITRSDAICGPVGDCNAVQQSPYASLFGLIPIGLLGVMGYIAIGVVWLVSEFGDKKWREVSLLCLWALLLIGTIFSIYLTFLEPFVIGATCAWCLTSAVVMTLLFLNSTASIQQMGGLSHLKFIRHEGGWFR
jgi:uncharacterized membrane protein/thiol-disulfide isomerase/thioredoxin